jgi:ribonuclease HI
MTFAVQPVGFAGASCKAEKDALELPLVIIAQDLTKYFHTNLFVGMDSQSSLMALNTGPLHDFGHSCTGYNWSQTFQSYIDTANALDSNFYLQWIPAHIGIKPNEAVNNLAYHYATIFPDDIQAI